MGKQTTKMNNQSKLTQKKHAKRKTRTSATFSIFASQSKPSFQDYDTRKHQFSPICRPPHDNIQVCSQSDPTSRERTTNETFTVSESGIASVNRPILIPLDKSNVNQWNYQIAKKPKLLTFPDLRNQTRPLFPIFCFGVPRNYERQ